MDFDFIFILKIKIPSKSLVLQLEGWKFVWKSRLLQIHASESYSLIKESEYLIIVQGPFRQHRLFRLRATLFLDRLTKGQRFLFYKCCQNAFLDDRETTARDTWWCHSIHSNIINAFVCLRPIVEWGQFVSRGFCTMRLRNMIP